MGTLVLHQFEVSPFCDKVRRVLNYKRRRYETREVPPDEPFARLRRPDPLGKVPMLEHGDRVITDSTDIARYLDELFPEPPIYPDDPRERALCHVLEDWADESLYFFEIWFRFGLAENAGEWSRRSVEAEPAFLRRATRRTLPARMRSVLKRQGLGRKPAEKVLEEFDRHLMTIDSWLGDDRDWLAGSQLSIADIAVYSQLVRAAETGEAAAVMGAHPRLLGWMERVNMRTAPCL